MSPSLQRLKPQYQSNSNTQYFRYAYRTSWLDFGKIAVNSGLAVVILIYFFPHPKFILFCWCIAFLIWAIWRMKRAKKMQKLNEFRLPNDIWIVFHKKYPQFHEAHQHYIEESFKDYLALHLRKKQSYAMPSHAVDALWHLLLEQFSTFYVQMCQNLLGFELLHKPHEASPNRMQKRMQNRQLLNTWMVSCSLHQIDQRQPKAIPRLFLADQISVWDNGVIFNMAAMNTLFQQRPTQGQSTIYSCSSSTSSFSDSNTFASSDSDHCHAADSNDSSSSCSSCSSGGD